MFDEEVRDTILFHIPHSSEYIPNWDGYLIGRIQLRKQIKTLTDTATEQIFNVNGIKKIIFPYSRFFCDVERLLENEPMENVGMGYYYTHDINGKPFRLIKKELLDIVLTLYKQHHLYFIEEVNKKLIKHSVCRIIDCHSFCDEPLKCDIHKKRDRPDICLGTDDYHTPDYLLSTLRNFFIKKGFSVSINYPYSGTIVPQYYIGKNPNIHSIMVELNKKLYMTEQNFVIERKVIELKQLLNEVFSNF